MSDNRIFSDMESISAFLYALWRTITGEPPTEEEIKKIYEQYKEGVKNEKV